MSTTDLPSTGFCVALLAALDARSGLDGVQVAHDWQGPDTAPEGIYLTDFETGAGPSGTLAPANLTASRQRLNDDAVIPVTCQSWIASETPQDSAAAFARVAELFAHVVDACQQTPAMAQSIDWVQGIAYRTRRATFQTGYAAQLIGSITTRSRLL